MNFAAIRRGPVINRVEALFALFDLFVLIFIYVGRRKSEQTARWKFSGVCWGIKSIEVITISAYFCYIGGGAY